MVSKYAWSWWTLLKLLMVHGYLWLSMIANGYKNPKKIDGWIPPPNFFATELGLPGSTPSGPLSGPGGSSNAKARGKRSSTRPGGIGWCYGDFHGDFFMGALNGEITIYHHLSLWEYESKFNDNGDNFEWGDIVPMGYMVIYDGWRWWPPSFFHGICSWDLFMAL